MDLVRKLCLDLFAMAGFQVTLYGRFWVTPKDIISIVKPRIFIGSSSEAKDLRRLYTLAFKQLPRDFRYRLARFSGMLRSGTFPVACKSSA